MINIKGTAGMAKHAINCIVITITNRYQTISGQEHLLSYTALHLSVEREAFPTVGTKCLASNLCYKDSVLQSTMRESSYPSESLLHNFVSRPNARPLHLKVEY